VTTAIFGPPLGDTPYDGGLVAKIARLPLVQQVADFTIVNPNVVLLGRVHGRLLPGEAPATIGGSLDGEYSKVGRVTVTHGRLPDPGRIDEVFLSTGAARQAGVRVGAVVPVGFFTNAQLALPDCCAANGTGKAAPHLKVNLRVVGIGVANPDELIEDDVDRLADSTVVLTPALMRKLIPCCAFVTQTGITVTAGIATRPSSPRRSPACGAKPKCPARAGWARHIARLARRKPNGRSSRSPSRSRCSARSSRSRCSSWLVRPSAVNCAPVAPNAR
jgi:hypothetical protein